MKKILVVDDDTDILLLVKIMLHMNNFTVEATSRWEDINHLLVNFRPDLILLDVSLSGADGRDICKTIKWSEETRHIPVILFSANAEMGNSISDCRAQAFIEKPFEFSQLLQVIGSHVN